MKSKSKQFWNTGKNPILGYRYEGLGQQARARDSFYSLTPKTTQLCSQ